MTQYITAKTSTDEVCSGKHHKCFFGCPTNRKRVKAHTHTRVLKYITKEQSCSFRCHPSKICGSMCSRLGTVQGICFLYCFFKCVCWIVPSYPAWVALRPTTYFCFPRAVLISGMQLARVLRSRANVIQKMGKWLSGQMLGEKNRKMQVSVKGKHEVLLSRQESRATRSAAPRF